MKKYLDVNTKKILMILTLVSLIISCNDDRQVLELNTEITTENITKIVDKISENKEIDNQKIDLIINYFNNYSNYRDSLIGKTLNEILESETKKERTKKNQIIKQLSKNIAFNNTFAIVLETIKTYDEENKIPINLFIYAMKNMGNKTIKSVNGFIEFYDGQNNLIKKYGVEFNYKLLPGKSVTQQFPYDHDPNNPRDIYIRTSYKSTIIIWKPIRLVYEDGTLIDLSIKI
jgi:hypothetical protein